MTYSNFKNKIARPLFIVAAGFFLSACKKDYPDSVTTGAPVFYFKGEVDGTLQNIQAGVNDYYMYSSYVQDINNVYQFIGDLKQTNCTNCANRIQFLMNDYQASSPNTSVNMDSSLKNKYYPIGEPGGTPTKYPVLFVSKFISGANYSWDFGDGITSSDQNLTHAYSTPGNYNVVLTTTLTNGCASSVSNTVKVRNTNTKTVINIMGETSIRMGDTALLGANCNPQCSNISWQWSNGKTDSSIMAFPTTTTTYWVTGKCNSSGKSDSATVTVEVLPAAQTCKTRFNFYLQDVNNTNPLSLSNVTILWTDASGKVYTSNSVDQPSDSYLRIISTENYSKNELGQLTRKIAVKFRCKVFNGSNALLIDNGEAVIAVAYK